MEEGMKFDDLYFHIHYCSSRQIYEPHEYVSKIVRTLGHHELIWVTGGRGNLFIEKRVYPVKEGMLYYIRPGVPHSLERDKDAPPGFLTVHFDYAAVSFREGSWSVTGDPAALPLHPAQETADVYGIGQLFEKMVGCWFEKLPGYAFAARTLLQQLLIAVVKSAKNRDRNYAVSLKVEKAIHMMRENIGRKMTLNELAKSVRLSPAYLSRAFKETTGTTVTRFYNGLVMDKAKALMLEGCHKVKELAEALGFADEFYFSRLFKSVEGMSPSEYYIKNIHGI
jgi:AraC-like DNA-binding protein